MTSMIDRVAEAIMEECSWDITTSASRRAARAAIEAMKEPTLSMLNAVADAEDELGYSHAAHEVMACLDSWPIMITAALAESKEG